MKSHMGSPQSCSETQMTLIKPTCRNWLDCRAAVCKICFLKTEFVLLIFSLGLRSGIEFDAGSFWQIPSCERHFTCKHKSLNLQHTGTYESVLTY